MSTDCEVAELVQMLQSSINAMLYAPPLTDEQRARRLADGVNSNLRKLGGSAEYVEHDAGFVTLNLKLPAALAAVAWPTRS